MNADVERLIDALQTIAFFLPTVGEEAEDVLRLKRIAANARASYLDSGAEARKFRDLDY